MRLLPPPACSQSRELLAPRQPDWIAALVTGLVALAFCQSAPAQQPAGPVLRLSGRTIRATLQEPELVPAPKQSDRFAPITELTLDTSAPPGPLWPPDLAADVLGRRPPLVLAPGMTRPWPPQAICWYGVPLHYAPIYGHRGARAGLPCACRATSTSAEYGTAREPAAPSDIPSP